MPPGPIQDEDDLLGGTSARLLGKGGELHLEERNIDGGGQMKERTARGGMDKPNQIAPFVAVLHRRQRSLAVKTPDLVQDRLEADPVFVHGPDFDLRLGIGGGDRLEEWSQLFLNASCRAGSASTWRGRGLRRLPSRRTK